ncbi:MAG: SIS domain-containing protein [Deltaproteobacteria bacterium]|nr:SIS domain-containing protein [Deltaproteobacteria bacterium]
MNVVHKIFDFLTRWPICIGRNPCSAPAPSIILFPFLKHVFFCGLAGILSVNRPVEKSKRKSKAADAGASLSKYFAHALKYDLQSVLSGAVGSDRYLGGDDAITEMDKNILLLKSALPFEHLFFDVQKTGQLSDLSAKMDLFLKQEDIILEENAGRFYTADMEVINARLIALKDVAWAVKKDILENVDSIKKLAGVDTVGMLSPAALKKYREMNFLLNCLDRLEVRGRDSAGVQLSFTLEDGKAFSQVVEKLKRKGLYELFTARTKPSDLISGSIGLTVRAPKKKPAPADTAISFTYKTSSIIGELGLNCRDLREAISRDRIFQEFAGQVVSFEASIAHTRWASVGSITEENGHPVNNFTQGHSPVRSYPHYGAGDWSVSCVLNGDIDNYETLRHTLDAGDAIAPELTTDTKMIPLQIEKYLYIGHDLAEAFRLAVNDFEGSHAIAMVSNVEPGKVFLALRGSGQSIYIGVAPDQYIFSSELYGLVEGTPLFFKMDGEMPSPGKNPDQAGQVFILDQESAGGTEGITAFFYDGTPLKIDETEIRRAEITTRDIDRGHYPHYFLKEVTEAAQSVRKTLRGKYRISADENGQRQVAFNLGADVVPDKLKASLVAGGIKQIFVIGHGTAAVAASAVAGAMERYLGGKAIKIGAKIASELSGFCLKDDFRDTLIIPITQSGTTTDTNRAVAMAVERGASAIAVVNRRQSDITTKTQGVFYTSDGRDIEMSVASTKAFYSQIIAGSVLALFFAQLLKTVSDDVIAQELVNLEKVPAMMNDVLAKKDKIRESARRMAGQKKYWAIVGSGPNKVAADEIRIKLSELCYKTISSDVVENKKHIDLSAEPLILVCAGGNQETVIGDIIKDAAIFKAHKASVVVFADEGENRFDKIADTVIGLPKADAHRSVILNTLAGHLWGYYAACTIDEDAWFFREFRTRLDLAIREQSRKNYSLYDRLFDANFRRIVGEFAVNFNQRRNDGAFAFMNSKTIADIALLLKYAVGKLLLEDFRHDFKADDGLASPIDLLDVALGHAVDETSRPIDAIKHQAKTVTVGTSRKEQPLRGVIFDLLAALAFPAKAVAGGNVLAMGRMQKAIAAVSGYTLYDVDHLDAEGKPNDGSTIAIREKSGIAREMTSRVDTSGVLMGTKKTIVRTGAVYVGKGKSDGAAIVIIPLLGEGVGIAHLLLLHVSFNEALTIGEKKEIIGDRFNDIRNLINEYNMTWHDEYLNRVPLDVLIGEPVEVVAEQIKESLQGR